MRIKEHHHNGNDYHKLSQKEIAGTIYTGESAVKKKGNEDIDGVKNFLEFPTLPNTTPTEDNEWARKKDVDDVAAQLPDATIGASDALIDSADTQGSISQFQTNPVKVKDINFNESDGTIRVKFDLKDDNGAGGCFGRIYVNDVAVGTTREETGGSWQTYSEDISVNNDDNVQLKVWYDNGGGGVGGQYRNFRLYYTKELDVISGTINQD